MKHLVMARRTGGAPSGHRIAATTLPYPVILSVSEGSRFTTGDPSLTLRMTGAALRMMSAALRKAGAALRKAGAALRKTGAALRKTGAALRKTVAALRMTVPALTIAGAALILVTPLAHAAESERESLTSLTKRAAAYTSRPAIYHWRKSDYTLQAVAGQFAEFNNFNSEYYGLLSQWPVGGNALQLGFRHVTVKATPAAKEMAKTPYVQAGHPSRNELITGFKAPLLEGIGSQITDLLPQSQLVFSGLIRLHFFDYGTESSGGERFASLFKPKLSPKSVDKIRQKAPAAMRPSESGQAIGLGLTLDQYFPMQLGAIVASASFLLMKDIADGDHTLGRWLEYDLAVGYDF